MPIVLGILAAFVLAGLALKPLSDPDLWWHLVIGRWMHFHSGVPKRELWNEFAAGEPFVAYSWLPERIFYSVEAAGGMPGLLSLKWLLATLILAVLLLCCCRLCKDWILGSLLTLAAALACQPYFGLRPQAISWLCAVFVLYFSERLCRHSRKTKEYILLGLAICLWANSHITTVFGLLMAVLWVAGRSHHPVKTASYVLVVCFIGSLVTPYAGREWLVLFQKGQHPFDHMYIREFQPATIFSSATLSLLSLLLFFFYLMKRSAHLPISFPRVLLVLLFFFAGLTVQKFVPYAAIVLALSCAAQVGRLSRRASLSDAPVPSSRISYILGGVLIGGLLLASLQFLENRKYPIDTTLVAVEPVEFIAKHELPWPVMNGFNDGGYLLYRESGPNGVPYNRVRLDGRTNVNSPEVTQAFLAALHANSNWKSFFELVQPKTVLWEKRFPLTELLSLSNEWCEVFPETGDSNWKVFLQKDEYLKRKDELTAIGCGKGPEKSSTATLPPVKTPEPAVTNKSARRQAVDSLIDEQLESDVEVTLDDQAAEIVESMTEGLANPAHQGSPPPAPSP